MYLVRMICGKVIIKNSRGFIENPLEQAGYSFNLLRYLFFDAFGYLHGKIFGTVNPIEQQG